MKYIVTRAVCKLANGCRIAIKYSSDASKENACNDIEQFRAKLAKALNTQSANAPVIEPSALPIKSIALTYYEQDGRL